MSAAELNPGQRAAVDSTSRRIVVSAGAGSGKTRVLAVRFADSVLRGEAAGEPMPMRSVLLITFTDKAAGELVERVRRVFLERGRPDLARGVDGAWISTIHGFCARIVRRHALELGVDPGFGVVVDPQVGVLRREAFERAASGLLSESGVASLMAQHGPEVLRKSVRSSYDRVRSMGSDVSQVVPCASSDLAAALHTLVPILRDTIAGYGSLPSNLTVASNTEKFTAAAARALSLAAGSVDRGSAVEAAGLHERFRGAMRGGDETKRLTGAANDALGVASRAGVDVLAADAAASWLDLLASYGRSYEDAKVTLGVLDFEDLQLLTRRLWCEHPESALRYERQFGQVMIDEFQDTNSLQFEAIRPVAGRGLCLVGDVQQSIYRFRDADVGLFVDQRRSAEAGDDGESCRLTVNYRSHPEVLGTLNHLFARPGFFGDDYLHLDDAGTHPSDVSWPTGAPRTEVIIVDKEGRSGDSWRDAEARALARRLRELVDERRMTPGDLVVLVRAMTKALPFVEALRAVGFEVFAGDAGGFYATPEVADVRSLLRVLANPLDGEGVLGLLAGGLGGLSDDALCLLAMSRPDGDLWAALSAAGELGLSVEEAARAGLVRDTVDLLRGRQGRVRLADSILYAISALGPGGGCFSHPGARGNLRKTARLAAEFERSTPADPAAFLRYLADRETYIRREPAVSGAVEGSGAVRVMSVHGAKGLEFPVVVVADLGHGAGRSSDAFMVVKESGSLVAVADVSKSAPDKAPKASAWKRGDEEDERLDLEESKRVFYVACTRAEQALILTGSATLSKPPGAKTDIDRLRAALDAAGPEGVPGLAVTRVMAADGADEPVAGEAHRSLRPRQDAAAAAPVTILRDPEPIAVPAETSYTALSLYEKCGYRFFAERMLGVGSIDTVEGQDPRALGSALHGALQTLAEGRIVDDTRLRALARAHGLASEATGRLRAAVEAFTASPAGGLLAAGRPEVPFAVRVVGGIVAGNMDLVLRDGDRATVVDYKTGLSAVADERRYGSQAEVYALALLVDGCTGVNVRFVRVEAGCSEAEFVFTASDRPRIEARIGEAFARMSRGEFARLRSFDVVVCPDCPVSGGLCPVTHPGARAAASG